MRSSNLPGNFFVLAILIGLVFGCATTGGNDRRLVTASGEAPISDQLVSPGHQSRIVPWDTLTLEASESYELSRSASSSPGLQGAVKRLNARRKAIATLAERIANYPAAEAPPGETQDLAIAEFARRHPSVDTAVRVALENGWTEEVVSGGQGRLALTLKLSLKPIAEVVLLQGGGFSPETEIASELNQRSWAQRQAMKKAREQLTKELGALAPRPGWTIARWAAIAPDNAALLQESLQNARVVRSEEKPPAQPGEEPRWLIELEADAASLLQKARADIEQIEKNQPADLN